MRIWLPFWHEDYWPTRVKNLEATIRVFMAVDCSDPDHCSGPEGLNARACEICTAQNTVLTAAASEASGSDDGAA